MPGHYDHKKFYDGYKPGQSDFDTLHNNIRSAFARIQRTIVGSGALQKLTVEAQTPASLFVGIAPCDLIAPDGFSFGWESTQLVNCSQSTHGSVLGSTAPLTNGAKRYIVLAGAYKTAESDQRIDAHGNSIFFNQDSSFEIRVYQTNDVAIADDKFDSVTLDTLLNSIRTANAIPMVVIERDFGQTAIQQSDIYVLVQYVGVDEGNLESEARAVRRHHAYGGIPAVQNDTGTVAANATSVPGAGGRLSVTGGEIVSMNWLDPVLDEIKTITVTVPAKIIDFANPNTKYMVRMKVGNDRIPVIYSGTGEFGLDPDISPTGTGNEGGSELGFRATMMDIPLFQVETGLTGTIPTVTAIVNNAAARLAAVENTQNQTSASAGVVADDLNDYIDNPTKQGDILWGGGIGNLLAGASQAQATVYPGAAHFIERGLGSFVNRRVITWNASNLTFSADGEYIIYVNQSGQVVRNLIDVHNTATLNCPPYCIPVGFVKVETITGNKTITRYLSFGPESRALDSLDWFCGASPNDTKIFTPGGAMITNVGRKVVTPHISNMSIASHWIEGAAQTIAGNAQELRYMYLVPVPSNDPFSVPADTQILCRIKFSASPPTKSGLHPTELIAGRRIPYFGAVLCTGNADVKVLGGPYPMRLKGRVYLTPSSGYHQNSDTIIGSPPTISAVGIDFTDAQQPKVAKVLWYSLSRDGSEQVYTGAGARITYGAGGEVAAEWPPMGNTTSGNDYLQKGEAIPVLNKINGASHVALRAANLVTNDKIVLEGWEEDLMHPFSDIPVTIS